jgi:hypothetical protein
MLSTILAAQRDASKRVAEARRFSLRLPLIGSVRVPPPDQLAFFGVLGGLVILELIDWPVAVAIGIGSAVVSRQVADSEPSAAHPNNSES